VRLPRIPPGIMEGVDPLDVLGVKPGAAPEEVTAAYRSLAKRWHPDRAAGDRARSKEAERRMAEINAAYAALREGGPTASGHGDDAARTRAPGRAPPGRGGRRATGSRPPCAAGWDASCCGRCARARRSSGWSGSRRGRRPPRRSW
jgi:curved DNA-binding protein CbpA